MENNLHGAFIAWGAVIGAVVGPFALPLDVGWAIGTGAVAGGIIGWLIAVALVAFGMILGALLVLGIGAGILFIAISAVGGLGILIFGDNKEYSEASPLKGPDTEKEARSVYITNSCREEVKVILHFKSSLNNLWTTCGGWKFAPKERSYISCDGKRVKSKNANLFYYGESTSFAWYEPDSSKGLTVRHNGSAYKMRHSVRPTDRDNDFVIDFRCGSSG